MLLGDVRHGNVSPFTFYENGVPVGDIWTSMSLWVRKRA
jgi:hypothetical protein